VQALDKRTALTFALSYDFPDIAHILIEHGADVSIESREPLILAAKHGYAEIVRALLDKGADVNARSDVVGQTALMVASERGHTEVVRILLDKGADPKLKAEDYWTALDLAEGVGHESIVNMLKAAGVKEKHPLEGDSPEARFLRIAIRYEPDPNLKKQWKYVMTPAEYYSMGVGICESLRGGKEEVALIEGTLIKDIGGFYGGYFALGLVAAAKEVICPETMK
jgi:hypothetical protein